MRKIIDDTRDPAAGAAYAGASFYVWDESPKAARNWARKLAAAEQGEGREERTGSPRILVPVDFSPACEAAARHAQRIAKRDEGEIHLLHVFLSPRDVADPERAAPALLEVRRRTLERMRALERSIEAPTRTHVFAGEPGAVIRETARGIDADLLVMGAHRRQRPGKVGRVARSMQEDPPCPVRLVGPPAS
jgi:nucleotide-binding universal stress UspA family protein